MSAADAWTALNRRDWITRMGAGLGGTALASLLAGDLPRARADDPHGASPHPIPSDVAPRKPHFAPRAKSVIMLFQHGGPSQMDLFDPKPMLAKYDGKKYPGVLDVMSPEKLGGVMKSPFQFTKHGKSGIDVSELMPNFAKCVDQICLIRSMYTEHINHEPATWMFNTGRVIPGRPSLGSWVTYGLGSESRDLPAYVVLDNPVGQPNEGIRNWSSGWLPPLFQGTPFRSVGSPVFNLTPKQPIPVTAQSRRLAYLSEMAEAHRHAHPGEPELDARIASYQLAARMQLTATDALDLSKESKETQALYGLDQDVTAPYGRQCLMARRLVERGVRFVQLFVEGVVWDHHTNLESGLRSICARTDLPIAGLITDLGRRGLLDETLVVWGGEFGRLPVSESGNGRDHNPRGFSIWMAGGGVKPGHIHGATDDLGYEAIEGRMSVPDYHATLLRILGLDFKKLTFPLQGLNEGLISTIYQPRVFTEILA
jgi:hypothetical protein